MRSITTILLFQALISCAVQNKKQTAKDAFNVSHGVALDTSEIRFVHFPNSVAVIFPAGYGKQQFGRNMGFTNRTFFTPDTSLIKQIDTAIVNQYCVALTRFNDDVWSRTIENLEEHGDKKSLTTAKQQMADSKKRFERLCPQWQKELTYHYKQYIGFVTEEGKHIIYIQLIDFRQDPYNLKGVFGVSWIGGWHGWFETNTKRLHYHVEKNLLTINEDL